MQMQMCGARSRLARLVGELAIWAGCGEFMAKLLRSRRLSNAPIVCGAGDVADEVHVFLTSGRSVGIFRVRSPHVWISKSEIDKCAACSTISLELIHLINVHSGRFTANGSRSTLGS